ncbi:HAMP domain-containing histidine kinase [bacterium]|nr:HAMP domain-containing histidine kinase [bacterium]
MFLKWKTGTLNKKTNIDQLYKEELQKSVLLISYFNAINLLLNIDDEERLIMNIIKYSRILLNVPDLRIILKKKYQKNFREYNVDKNQLITKIIDFSGKTIISNGFQWAFTPSTDSPYISFFQQAVTNILHHLIEKSEITRKNLRIKELYEATKTHKDALQMIISEIENPIFLNDKEGNIILTNNAGMELINSKKVNIYKFLEKHVTDSYFINKKTPVLLIGEKYYKVSIGFFGKSESINMIIFHNITDFKHLDEMKNIFISGISHEIKTPLTSLITGIKLLHMGKLGQLNDEQKNFLNIIVSDSTYLMELLENLIYSSKQAAGIKEELNMNDINMSQIIDEVIGIYENSMKNKGIEIVKKIENVIFKSDYVKLRMILSNLISNAIKYNKENGNIKIIVQNLSNEIIISVIDAGIGIPENKINAVFNKFVRVEENSHFRNGAGLGLYITKQNVETLGGKINVYSKLGQGTNFIITLPKERKYENSKNN